MNLFTSRQLTAINHLSSAVWRKARQVAGDPTLRRWLVEYAIGRGGRPAGAQGRRPSYLAGLVIDREAPVACPWQDLLDGLPDNSVVLELAGFTLPLAPGDIGQAFVRQFADTESLLALHRFAWIARAGASVDLRWVAALWCAWLERYAIPDESWAWHSYTAAERLINITTFARQYGLPGPRKATLEALARHGPAILDRLEYYGDTQTGNHLANNGRGLFIGGLALGREDWVEFGGRILVHEARRIFAPSGVLREGSSHYHLLAASWYADAARVALAAGRPEARALAEIAERTRRVASRLMLPGGLPLIGDVSPDCPPSELDRGFADAAAEVDDATLANDGWVRMDLDPWHALLFAAPAGWAPLPGHAHRDFGSLELHHGATPVLCDLGRGTYGPAGETDIEARAHNTLTIDGIEPYPPNRPYYDDGFRRRIAGPEPELRCDERTIALSSASFARLPGVNLWRRCWRFDKARVVVEDRVDGHGQRRIARHFHTTLPVNRDGDHLRIGTFALRVAGDISIRQSRTWRAYGVSQPASSIEIVTEAVLPWSASAELTPR